jgi:hypothetical protein
MSGGQGSGGGGGGGYMSRGASIGLDSSGIVSEKKSMAFDVILRNNIHWNCLMCVSFYVYARRADIGIA